MNIHKVLWICPDSSHGVTGLAGNSCSGGPTKVMTEKRDSCDLVWKLNLTKNRLWRLLSQSPHFASEEAINPQALETDTHELETLPLATQSPKLSTTQLFSINVEYLLEREMKRTGGTV